MAVRFAAATDRYQATTGLPAGGVISMTCWAYVTTDLATVSSFVDLDQGAGSGVYNALLGIGSTRAIGLFDTEFNFLDSGVTMAVGAWYKVAAVINGTAWTVYAAAAADPLTSASTTQIAAATPLRMLIGSNVFSEYLNGRLANVKIWTAALTQTEIEAELDSWTAVRTTNLLRHHKFQVAELTDYSGNGNTLTAGSTNPTTEADPPIAVSTAVRPTYVADRGTTANATAATTSAVTLTSPTAITVGNYLLARVAVDNSGTNGVAPGCTVTDPRSNVWTVLGPALVDPGAAAAGATAYLAYTRVATAYQAADALTFNWGGISTTAKAIVVEEWGNIHSTAPVAVAAVTNNAAASTAVTVAITPTAVDQLVYTCLATEGIAADTFTGDADSTNGTWATLTTTASANATATNNQRVMGQYKVVTAPGAQSWDATITNRDWAALAVVFAAPALPPPVQPINSAALVRAHYW